MGDFPDAQELSQHLQDRFDVAADALSWPNFLYTAVVRDDCTSVYMAFDHSNVDAYSIQRIPAEIHELYAAGAEGRARGGGPGRQLRRLLRDRAGQTRTRSTTPTRSSAAGGSSSRGATASCPPSPSTSASNPAARLPKQKLLHEMLVTTRTPPRFAAYCRPFGGSQVGILAATSLIVHEIGGEPVYRTVVPLHTRAKSTLGGLRGVVRRRRAHRDPRRARRRGFDDALTMVRAALRANKSLAHLPIARVLRLLGSDFRPTSPDLYSIVSFVDARGIPGVGQWDELKAYALLRVSYGDQVCAWFTRLHGGPATGHAATRTRTIAYKNMRRYVEQLREHHHLGRPRRSAAAGAARGRAAAARFRRRG